VAGDRLARPVSGSKISNADILESLGGTKPAGSTIRNPPAGKSGAIPPRQLRFPAIKRTKTNAQILDALRTSTGGTTQTPAMPSKPTQPSGGLVSWLISFFD